jgi:hypothetical protein
MGGDGRRWEVKGGRGRREMGERERKSERDGRDRRDVRNGRRDELCAVHDYAILVHAIAYSSRCHNRSSNNGPPPAVFSNQLSAPSLPLLCPFSFVL